MTCPQTSGPEAAWLRSGTFSPDRLLVCLPSRSPVEALLARAARAAAALPACPLEIVAAPPHALHDRHRPLIRRMFGRWADVVHLVPHAGATVPFAVQAAGPTGLVVTDRPTVHTAWQQVPSLVTPADISGRAVLALVDPAHDHPGLVTVARDLAARFGVERVIACHAFAEGAPIGRDGWEVQAVASLEERLDIFLARVPYHDVPLVSRLLHAPVIGRAVERLAHAEDVALIVGRRQLRVDVPVLTLPGPPPRSPSIPTLARAWDGLVDFARGRRPLGGD